jgi:hypothetical protein
MICDSFLFYERSAHLDDVQQAQGVHSTPTSSRQEHIVVLSSGLLRAGKPDSPQNPEADIPFKGLIYRGFEPVMPAPGLLPHPAARSHAALALSEQTEI